jgi:hypothetical protein
MIQSTNALGLNYSVSNIHPVEITKIKTPN